MMMIFEQSETIVPKSFLLIKRPKDGYLIILNVYNKVKNVENLFALILRNDKQKKELIFFHILFYTTLVCVAT